MITKGIAKLPVQFERPLREYKAAYLKYMEMRSRPGADAPRLASVWRQYQTAALQIEARLIREYGKEVAEQMLEQAIGWKTLPRV
jgi:hypothetical protein